MFRYSTRLKRRSGIRPSIGAAVRQEPEGGLAALPAAGPVPPPGRTGVIPGASPVGAALGAPSSWMSPVHPHASTAASVGAAQWSAFTRLSCKRHAKRDHQSEADSRLL